MTDSQQVRGHHGEAHAEDRAEDQAQDRGQDRAQGGDPGRDRPAGSGDDRSREAPAGGPERVAAQHQAHGQSVASWTAVGIIMLGALIMAIAVVIMTVWLFVVGAVVVLLGAAAGKVLSAMGFGVSGRPGY